MSLSRLGLLRRSGFLARQPLAAVRTRAGPDFKFDFRSGKYDNPIPKDEDLNSEWVFPDQSEFYLNGPVTPQRWMGVVTVRVAMAIGSFITAQILMYFAPENPAAPKTYEGHLWEEYGNDPANPPQTQEEIRNWLYYGLQGRRRYENSDIIAEKN